MLNQVRTSLILAALAALPAAAQPGFRGEYLTELSVSETRMLQLAEAIPEAKYTWRPAPGVRSISEVFLHVAAANFNLPKLIGTPPPAGFAAKGYDTSTTDKAKVIAALKDSFAHVRKAIDNLADADADKKLPWFGKENTYRGILFFMTRHTGEHLGQAIAYARMNGVTPPWSEEPKR
jgi:uncharacterized damage-inducible protein DinB